MALASYTNFDGTWPGSTSQCRSYSLGTITTIAPSADWASSIGYASRLYVVATNGATNSVSWKVQGSADGSAWFDLATRADSSAAYATTAATTTASSVGVLFLNPLDVPRFVRVSVTAANANGTSFQLWMER